MGILDFFRKKKKSAVNDEEKTDARIEALKARADQSVADLQKCQRKTEHAMRAMTEEEARMLLETVDEEPAEAEVEEEKAA